MENYKGKVAVVTGGANGIGLGIASELGKRGCNIVITDINVEWGKEATKRLESEGSKVMYIEHDVTKEASWDNMIEIVKKEYSEIHYLFNNAGIMLRPRPLTQMTMKDWQWVIDVNFWGALFGLRKFTDLMLSQEANGLIVTTASTASVAPFSLWGPYSVSKAAVLRTVECYQAEANMMKNPKVRYAVAMPGTVESEISNCEVYRPDEYMACDERAEYVAPSKAGTPQGEALGKLTAEVATERILKQIDYGYTYIFTHRDLTTGLLLEQVNAVLLNKQVVDQTSYDYGYYAKKIERKKA